MNPAQLNNPPNPVKLPKTAALKRAVVYLRQKLRLSPRRITKFIVIAAVTFGALWLLLTYVVGITQVSGTSMVPTLHNGDVLVVWKFPQTWEKLTGGQYIPKRGNIMIINDTNNNGEQWVKRVIGLPSERINVSNGKVTVYNTQHPNGFDPDSAPYGKNLPSTGGAFSGTVGDGQIFVMGDNRQLAGSIDSRSSLGNIPSSYIVGHVVLRIYPFSNITVF